MKVKTKGYQITKVETTTDKISGRGGLALILRYFETIKVFCVIDNLVGHLFWHGNGKSAGFIIRQIMAKMVDGTDKSIGGFDRLKQDESYGAVIETKQGDMVSSHTVKRFFRKFTGLKHRLWKKVLTELFVWRLKMEAPSIIVLDIDTMVLDNDDAKKRHGVDVTYKNKKGFQPLQISWKNKIVNAIFRRGSAHSNHGNDVQKLVGEVVKVIRSRYRADVPILITADSGFFDQKNFEYFEKKLKIFYVCTGKFYKEIKRYIKSVGRGEFKTFQNKTSSWEYVEFGNKLDSWKEYRRAIYTTLLQEEDQMLLDFARPDNILYTNLGLCPEMTINLKESGNEEYLQCEKIIELAHGRGRSELIHRSLKEFMGKEQLPFKQFGMNGAYYYTQLITHFLYECYKEDVGYDVVKVSGYPTGFRRKLIDFAAKIVKTGNKILLQVTKTVWSQNKVNELWKRCNCPVPILE